MTIDSIVSGSPADRSLAGSGAVATPGSVRTPASKLETSTAVKEKAPPSSLDDVKQAVSELNKSAQENAQGIEFSIDTDSKRTIVKVIDTATKEVLRQMPTPEALQIAKSLDKFQGQLIHQTA